MRLYVDQDSLHGAVIDGLRARGVDVLTAVESGNSRLSDEDQLRFSTRESRILFTGNMKDFAKLHRDWIRTGESHAGIIVKTVQTLPIGEQIRGIIAVLTTTTDATDQIWYL